MLTRQYKTIVVTGGAGFIGSNFVRYWLHRYPKWRVVNFDALTYAGNRDSLKDIESDPGYQERYAFVQGDIRDFNALCNLFDLFKPQYVVNFAAETHNSRAVVEPRVFFETNVVGTQSLMHACYTRQVPRVHHISTCEVFGDLALDAAESFSEDTPYDPNTPYNASKAAADLAVRSYHRTFGLPVTISICSNNYGPYQFPEKLIPHFTIRGMRGEKMPLYKSSQNKREWLHVVDHCRAVEAILLDGRIGETYNIGSGIEADIETIADSIIRELGLDDSVKKYVPDRPGHDRRYLLNSQKISDQLGWEPEIGFEDGLKQTIEWYRQNEWWWQPLLERSSVDEEGWASSKDE
ncbi:dTDP-glucose 4,6-dehydratase [candidate division GN15 bacterium]|nr:dTDP-glucose 4,6-dehydratase [candidate division GN15 bacterium]